MAENQSKSVRKMIRKKRFKRFEKCFETYFESDSRLQSIIETISLRERLWKAFTDDDSDDTNDDNDFVGFDSDSNKIKELLRKQWKKRIQAIHAPPKEKASPKSILREARLQISSQTLRRIRSGHETRSGQPGFIVCAICQTTKYYSHVQRRYGVFSCESCSKFFARFLKSPKQLFCHKSGDCALQTASGRCAACWLKHCLHKFQIDAQTRRAVLALAPKLSRDAHVSLITVETEFHPSTPPAPSGAPLLMLASRLPASSGPRVKRVCRRAVAGPRAATFAAKAEVEDEEDSDSLPVDVYLCRHKRDSKVPHF